MSSHIDAVLSETTYDINIEGIELQLKYNNSEWCVSPKDLAKKVVIDYYCSGSGLNYTLSKGEKVWYESASGPFKFHIGEKWYVFEKSRAFETDPPVQSPSVREMLSALSEKFYNDDILIELSDGNTYALLKKERKLLGCDRVFTNLKCLGLIHVIHTSVGRSIGNMTGLDFKSVMWPPTITQHETEIRKIYKEFFHE